MRVIDPHAPCRPAWCLEEAREFLQSHGLWWVGASTEELLANLLDMAYLRGKHWASGPETEVELAAAREELAQLKEPFIQLMKRLQMVKTDDDPECPTLLVRCRLTWTLWHQLRNIYEATLPPVDNTWLELREQLEEKD